MFHYFGNSTSDRDNIVIYFLVDSKYLEGFKEIRYVNFEIFDKLILPSICVWQRFKLSQSFLSIALMNSAFTFHPLRSTIFQRDLSLHSLLIFEETWLQQSSSWILRYLKIINDISSGKHSSIDGCRPGIRKHDRFSSWKNDFIKLTKRCAILIFW